MSPAYKRDSVAIHFTWKPEWPEVSKVLPIIERELAPYNPRPHWGKLFTMPPAQLQSHYEKLHDFIALATKFDPSGKFRNDYLSKNIFTVAS
jgi:xylitol oxidase